MKKKAEEQFSDPKLDGLKMEKTQRNSSLTSREGTMKKEIVSQLQIGEGKFLSDFKQVNKEIENHYGQFYRTNIEENDLQQRFESFVENLNSTQLQQHENQELEDEISIDEVRNALAFFDLLGIALLESFNAGFENGTLSVSQRRGIYLIDPKR